ncbi:hypothetical protein E2P81_ATG09190 [Venturia nashicola]|uniref:Uncharacterized protein n=1 Tax=Venturia nashicola TaxID=86259 RepID=A0A4Z1NG38_9PEZI|nr:hypothetical protein E6O75_ATG09390 [Venturia nashicola]TLD20120.1 hypothetical protein E2P81_ATG09190 [Venturia nashicola]
MSTPDLVANGASTPPPPQQESDSTTQPSKRKRDSAEDDAPRTNGTSALPQQRPPAKPQDAPLLDTLNDIFTVLSDYDTAPSILTFNITAELKNISTSSEPSNKRAKLSQDAPATIADKLKQGQYADLDALVQDVDTAVNAILAPIRAKDGNSYPSPYGRPNPLSPQEMNLRNEVLALQKVLGDMVDAEKSRLALKETAEHSAADATNGDSMSQNVAVKAEVVDGEVLQNGKTVLTLFANAPGSRQLFSSFQKPITVKPKSESNENASVEVVAPLRESGLPSFISTTKIPSLPVGEDTKNKKASTFGALFAPPPSLPKLQPPKPSKKLTTTGNTIAFVPLDQPARSARRDGFNYPAAKQSVGNWLGYGGVDSPQEPTSPQAKRKQRDRTLSTGEAFQAPSPEEKEAQKRAETEALFRKVYGSFAPNHDNAGAVIPQETRNEVWWNKIADRFAAVNMAIDPALLDLGVKEPVDPETEDAAFKEAVESFDPAALGLDKLEEEEKEDKEVEEMLQEVSNLLETLSSHQRIRNSSLATSSRTTVGQNNPLTDLMGSPSTPSTAEMETYKTLKLQLAVLVNSLPPYAVARLNGDQLEELNIKTSIVIETDNPRGVMAEDESARALKQQAYAATAGPMVPNLHRAGSGTYGNYNATPSQYNRTPGASATSRPAAPGFYPSQAQQSRPAALSYQRSGGGVQTFSGGYPTTTPRAGFNPQAFPQSAPRPANFNSSSSLQNIYNLTGQKTSFAQSQQTQQQHYQGTPTASRQYAQSSAPSSAYQPRAQPPAQMYSYASSQAPQPRTASPLTTSGSIAPPQLNHPRSQYQPPTTGAPKQNPSYYRPTSVGQGGGQSFAGPSFGGQQHQQHQQRMSAMGTPSRPMSGTPQPGTPVQNGGYAAPGQVNGGGPSPVPQQS